MRYAVVVAPPRFALPPEGNVFKAPEPVGPVCAAFARGGRRVLLVPSTKALEADFVHALTAVGEGADLVIYAAAATTTHAERVTVRVDEDTAKHADLAFLSDAVAARQPRSALFVVEACHDGDADDPILAAKHVDAIVGALCARSRGYGALVGVRPASRGSATEWPFTRHLLAALDDPASRDERGCVATSLVYARLRQDGAINEHVQSFDFVPGQNESPIVDPPVQAPRAAEPSLPAIESLLDLADDAVDRGALAEALAGYKAALMAAQHGDSRARASIYARIGGLKRAQGRPREAELNFEKALIADPLHRGALDALVDLATESNEVNRVVEWRQKRLKALAGADERVAELCAIAEAHSAGRSDPRAALEALDQALAVEGKGTAALESLRRAYEKLQRWPRVVDVVALLAESAADDKERSTLRCAAADLALGRLGDEPRGLDLLEQATEDDPRNDTALRALVALRTTRGEYKAIDARYVRTIERYVTLGDTDRAWDTYGKLGVLRRDKLGDPAGAVEAFTGALGCKPDDVETRTLLAETHLAAGDEVRAVAEFERVAQIAPTRSSTYSRLLGLHRRAGRTDRAWLAGSVLAELGCADMDQELFVDQYRPDGPIRPARSLDAAAWSELLRAPGADEVVSAILRAIVGTATAIRVDELRQARQLVALEPAKRQSTTSTVSVVRSFHWAAQVLGVDEPDLYVMESVPGGIAAIHAPAPTTALGPDVLRGLTAKDLAFLAGRHLTYYRPESYALLCHPTLDDLSALFLGAVQVILPDVEAPPALRDAAARKRNALAKQATDDEKRNLQRAVEGLQAAGGRVDLAAWIRSVELTAQRAGLLLCGDLAVAMARLRAEADTRAIAELTFDQKRGDLLAFCASEKLALARARLGVDLAPSLSVPPPGELQAG